MCATAIDVRRQRGRGARRRTRSARSRAASSIDRFCARASAATSTRSATNGTPSRAGERGAERLVGVRFLAAQLVIQVRGARDRQRAVLLELAQDQQQRDRVGAAGEADEHTVRPPRSSA